MAKLLFIVEDCFVITGRGGIDFTDERIYDPLEEYNRGGLSGKVRLKYSDGSDETVEVKLNRIHVSLGYGGDFLRVDCFLKDRRKEDVPRGTEVWLISLDGIPGWE